jgi:large repetitive protein
MMNIKKLFALSSLPLLILVFTGWYLTGCDDFEGDRLPDNEKFSTTGEEIYVTPGASTLIDLRSRIKSMENARISIVEKPERGTLNELEAGLLRYHPGKSLLKGRDHIIIEAVGNETTLGVDTIVIIIEPDTTNFPCLYAVEDTAHVETNTVKTIPVLENDRLCGAGDAVLSIYRQPLHGQVTVSGRNVLYTPDNNFEGEDSFIYQLSDGGDSAQVSLGYVRLLVGSAPDSCTFIVRDDIFTINDSTGQSHHIPVLANDELCTNDSVSLEIIHYPTYGTAVVTATTIQYTPDSTAVGRDSLSYRVCNRFTCGDASVIIKRQ